MAEAASDREWCHALRKCELHAHLSGSVRDSTIVEFLRETCDAELLSMADGLLDTKTGRTLKQCFALFPVLHRLIDSRERLRRIVREALEDYCADNCIYLELRTTPRSTSAFSSREYMDTVFETIHDFHSLVPTPTLSCRVLLSVSRDAPLAAAYDTLALARELLMASPPCRAHGLLAGIELSGNPARGSWRLGFQDFFARAREEFGERLRVSLHCAELRNDEETQSMLDFEPHRVGHAVCMSEANFERLMQLGIPVEVCLTSNLFTCSVPALAQHPAVTQLLPRKHPFTLCCDDAGLFRTSLTDEYLALLRTHACSRADLKRVAAYGAEMAFVDDKTRSRLRALLA